MIRKDQDEVIYLRKHLATIIRTKYLYPFPTLENNKQPLNYNSRKGSSENPIMLKTIENTTEYITLSSDEEDYKNI